MRTLSIYISIAVVFISCSRKQNPVEDDPFVGPTVISGQVKDTAGIIIVHAKVSLPADSAFESILTDADGRFKLMGFTPGKHRVRIEKIGFEIFESDVPDPVNGTSTIHPAMKRTSYIIPLAKPVSTGPVRLSGKKLEVDFDRDGIYEEFVVKGTAFSPAPIGGKPLSTAVYDRSVLWLKNLNANTVRTYSGVDKYFLRQAGQNGIRVIVSFWVNLDLDLSVKATRDQVIDDFATMVLDLKEYPGVLMWNIGNEQNISSTPNNGNSPYWYSLVQEMAIAAYKVEGTAFHPVCVNNWSLHNIGSVEMNANDSSLTYIDLWASNAYEQNFTSFFSSFRTKSAKPIVITEFGIDALNNVSKTEQEPVQAYFDSTNWTQIRAAGDVCVGATVFEFTDEWWKDSEGSITTHDFGGYPTNAHPDGYSNEEWWGIIAVTPDVNGDGLDEWRARKAYEMFQRNWK